MALMVSTIFVTPIDLKASDLKKIPGLTSGIFLPFFETMLELEIMPEKQYQFDRTSQADEVIIFNRKGISRSINHWKASGMIECGRE